VDVKGKRILIVGCGPVFEAPPAGLREALAELDVVLEWMDTGAACRTFNVLLSEDRPCAAALIAEYNGIAKKSHVGDKLAEMITVAELIFAAGVASAVTGTKSASGTYVPNVLYCNVGRYHAGVNIYHEYETLADIAGGLAATLPREEDFINPETAAMLNKYIMRKADIPAEKVHRAYRLIENLICSAPGAAS